MLGILLVLAGVLLFAVVVVIFFALFLSLSLGLSRRARYRSCGSLARKGKSAPAQRVS